MAEQSKGDLPGKNRSIKLLIEKCFLAPDSGQIKNEGKNFFDNCSFKKLRSRKNQGRCDEEEELQEKYFFVCHQKNCWHNPPRTNFRFVKWQKNQTNLDYSAILKYYNFSKLGHFKCLRWGRCFKYVFCSEKRISLLEIPNKKWSYCLLIIFWLIRASLVTIYITDFRVNEGFTSIL